VFPHPVERGQRQFHIPVPPSTSRMFFRFMVLVA